MLAKQGYTALELDMYGDGKQAHHPDDAQKFSSEVSQNEELAKAHFEAALAYNAVADKDSWTKGLAFLEESFKAK